MSRIVFWNVAQHALIPRCVRPKIMRRCWWLELQAVLKLFKNKIDIVTISQFRLFIAVFNWWDRSVDRSVGSSALIDEKCEITKTFWCQKNVDVKKLLMSKHFDVKSKVDVKQVFWRQTIAARIQERLSMITPAGMVDCLFFRGGGFFNVLNRYFGSAIQ